MQGFHVHNLMIMTADGIPLGLLRQDVFQNDSTHENYKHVPITKKKSHRWIDNLRTTYEISKSGKKVITVCDRECDIYEFLSEAEILKEYYVIRGAKDRGTIEENVNISEQFYQKGPDGHIKIPILGNGKRKNREADVDIRFMGPH